jgi:hypothetical protein
MNYALCNLKGFTFLMHNPGLSLKLKSEYEYDQEAKFINHTKQHRTFQI